MQIAIFGATGGIGAHVVREALAAGHGVRALVRDPRKLPADNGIEIVAGDLIDADAVDRTVAGSEAAIWAVGPTRNAADEVAVFETGARHLVAAMARHGVRRLVALSGAGITLPGEQKPIQGRLMSALVRVAARHVYEAKRREYEVFTAADLDWTLVRPPRVVDGPPSGTAVAGDRLAGSRVTQGDIAAFMVRELTDGRHLRAAPYISS